MLEALRSLRLELDSLVEKLRRLPGVIVTSTPIRQRVAEFYLSWSNLRPKLSTVGVPEEVISPVDRAVDELARLNSKRSNKSLYLRHLLNIRKILVTQVLLEVARVDASPVAGRPWVQILTSSVLSEIPGLTNDLIPAPLYGWASNMRKFLKRNGYDHNVFVMVAYRTNLKELLAAVKKTITGLGLHPVVAKDHQLTDDLYNPLACLLCCQYGIAIFDQGDTKQTHNSNVVYELAVMQTLKRPCMILKHKDLKTMPSDFLQKLYEPYRTKNEAISAIKEWWKRVSTNN